MPIAWSLVLRVRRLARRKKPPSFMLLVDVMYRQCSKAQAAEIYTLLDRAWPAFKATIGT